MTSLHAPSKLVTKMPAALTPVSGGLGCLWLLPAATVLSVCSAELTTPYLSDSKFRALLTFLPLILVRVCDKREWVGMP